LEASKKVQKIMEMNLKMKWPKNKKLKEKRKTRKTKRRIGMKVEVLQMLKTLRPFLMRMPIKKLIVKKRSISKKKIIELKRELLLHLKVPKNDSRLTKASQKLVIKKRNLENLHS